MVEMGALRVGEKRFLKMWKEFFTEYRVIITQLYFMAIRNDTKVLFLSLSLSLG